MISRCANLDCGASFDYRQGQLLRFQRNHPEGQIPANTHSVEHFWLCQLCCKTYMLENRKGFGVFIDRRFKMLSNKYVPRLIAAA